MTYYITLKILLLTEATILLYPIQMQLRNGKCSVYSLTTAFPLVASATHIDELCATQQILLPHGLNATECIHPPEYKRHVIKIDFFYYKMSHIISTSIGCIRKFSQ